MNRKIRFIISVTIGYILLVVFGALVVASLLQIAYDLLAELIK